MQVGRRAPAAGRRLLGAWLVAALVALAAPPGEATAQTAVTREQAQQLAAEAQSDPAALAQLRRVESIDGEGANLEAALRGADSKDLQERLGTLERALGGSGSGADAEAARTDAQQILDGFPEEEEPASAPPEASGDGDGGGGVDIGSLWIPLLIVAVIAAAVVALQLARNRERGARLAAEERGEGAPEPVSELEQRARDAEGAGDYEKALRLRYGIALRTLQERGAVSAGPSLTPGRLHRELGHPRTGELVGTFERVVYGGREADADDARQAREGWPVVVRDSAAAGGREEGS
jgi:hypothetical protein